MKRFAEFLVERRRLLFSVMLLLTVLCAILARRVPVNKDRTRYLPDSSNMKQGLFLMEADFPAAGDKSSIRVMFDDLDAGQKESVRKRLEAIPDVSSVSYEAADSSYNKNRHTLFIVHSSFAYGTDEERAIEKALEEDFAEYKMTYRNNDIQSTEVPLWLILCALALAVTVLLIMCSSWLEPLLFLVTIGAAVVINMGTNIVLPYIDVLTASIAPIIQLVLSMDYSIILMNRYRQEKKSAADKTRAMKAALAGAVSSIASSALTTAVGLLALVFLSFRLGAEMGVVLAKGVLISMLSVFTVLPLLILLFDKGLERTRKKSPHLRMGLPARLSRRAGAVMPVIFAILFVGSGILQTYTDITFTEKSEDPLADIFPKENTLVLLYKNEDEGRISRMISEIERDSRVRSVVGFANTLGREYDPEGMSEALNELGGGTEIKADTVRLLYYIAGGGKGSALTVAGFAGFLADPAMQEQALSGHPGGDIREKAEYLRKLSDKDRLCTGLTAGEMAEFFGINREDAARLYLYRALRHGLADSGTMTLPAFVDFVLHTVSDDAVYGSMFDPRALTSLRQIAAFADKDSIRAGRTAAEMASMLGLDEEMVRTVFVLHGAGDISGKTMTAADFLSFLCRDLMDERIFGEAFDEKTAAQLQATERLIQLAVSGRELPPQQMAGYLGLEAGTAEGLYYLYFSSDGEFQQEAAAATMPLTGFMEVLKAYADEEQLLKLARTEELLALAGSERLLEAAEMAQAIGMPEDEVLAVYAAEGSAAMSLRTFMSAALRLAPDNAVLRQIDNMIGLAESGTELDAPALAGLFGMEEAEVSRLLALTLVSQRTMSLAEFTGFVADRVLANESCAGSLSQEEAAGLRQLDRIVKLAVSAAPLDTGALARAFGIGNAEAEEAMRFYYGAAAGDQRMSVEEMAAYILSDPLLLSHMDDEQRGRLQSLQAIIRAVTDDTALSSAELASLLGMQGSQAEQIYILHLGLSGGGDAWKLSPRDFVSFAVSELLENGDAAEYFDKESADSLRLGQALIEAVLSDKSYTAAEMYGLLSPFTDAVSENDIEVLYLCCGSESAGDTGARMTIPRFLDFLSDELMRDGRFADYFDGTTKGEILKSESELKAAAAQMQGRGYSRLVLTSDYADESPETLAFVSRLNELREAYLDDSYLIGNSAMVSEMDAGFRREYLLISFITALAIFLVVLAAFRNPTLPLILTLLVQCGVYITVTVIGAYSGSIYYLALLIVQSILMGATIDYGIVFCNFYRESRKSSDVSGALQAAYEGSAHTIMTSGAILVLVLAALGGFATSAMISEVCVTLSIGVFIAILLILFVLPGTAAFFDRFIVGKRI